MEEELRDKKGLGPDHTASMFPDKVEPVASSAPGVSDI